MTNDNGLTLDIDALLEAAADTDVLVIGFDFMAERIVVDFRADNRERSLPLLELAPPMADAQERVAWLAERRPALASPDRFLFFVWPHTIKTLADSPVIDRILVRLRDEHGVDYRSACARLIADVRRAEHAERLAAIRGTDGFETLWERER
ncbi:MAG: hypothetical protein EPO65_04200 [Dehalococcoidia bacterium]|nr:MAG: hypothetical protein EPO65_04200 [Dehalococcoidia bacterium]